MYKNVFYNYKKSFTLTKKMITFIKSTDNSSLRRGA